MSSSKPKFSLFSNKSGHDVIANFQPAIEIALAENGWQITKREKYANHFWFLEMWLVQSQWSPIDFQLFLVFEDDEMHFSVAIALDEPGDHHLTSWQARIYLMKGWEQELPNFINELNMIRGKFSDTNN